MARMIERLSLSGILLRLVSVCGLYQTWVYANFGIRALANASTSPGDVKATLMLGRGAVVAAWETAAITVALWVAAWAFDAMKPGRRSDARKGRVFTAASIVAGCVIAAELPVGLMSTTTIGSSLPVYFNYNSLAICAIAACLMVAILRGQKDSAELERFV